MNASILRLFRYLIIVLAGIHGQLLHANHTVSLEISYRYVSDSTYEFTLIMYRSCDGLISLAPPNFQLQARSQSLSFLNTSAIFLARMPPLSPIQPTQIQDCSSDSSSFCIEEYTYRGTYTIPARARDWIFTASHCCIVYEFDNVVYNFAVISCGLNNLDFPDGNTSPVWHYRRTNIPGHLNDTAIDFPVKAICETKRYNVSQKATEFQGDSLAYHLYHVQTFYTPNIDTSSYISPYSFSNPVSRYGSGPFGIDVVTGDLWLKPKHVAAHGLNLFLIPVRAREYRNDTINPTGPVIIKREIGFIERHLVLIIEDSLDCVNDQVGMTFSKAGISNPNLGRELTIPCSDSSFKIYFTKKILNSSIDIDGSFLAVRDSATGQLYKLSYVSHYSTTNNTDSIGFHMDSLLPRGTYYISLKKGGDSNSLLSVCHFEALYGADSIKLVVGPIDLPELTGPPNGPGTFDSILQVYCGQSEIIFYVTDRVISSSIDQSGDDFQVFDINNVNLKQAIDSAVPYNSTGFFTNSIKVYFHSPLPESEGWMLRLKTGSDGNRLWNECYQEMDMDTLIIHEATPDVNLGSDTVLCPGQNFSLDAGSGYNTYLWNTSAQTQTIQIDSIGEYRVVVTNTFGCELSDTINITDITPKAGFVNTVNGPKVTFSNISVNAMNYTWYFGDGQQGAVANPVHNYSSKGWYEVCLMAGNNCDTSAFCDSVQITSLVGVDVQNQNNFELFPNPAGEFLYIRPNGHIINSIQVFDTEGRLIFTESGMIRQIDVRNWPSAIYVFQIFSDMGIETRKLIKVD